MHVRMCMHVYTMCTHTHALTHTHTLIHTNTHTHTRHADGRGRASVGGPAAAIAAKTGGAPAAGAAGAGSEAAAAAAAPAGAAGRGAAAAEGAACQGSGMIGVEPSAFCALISSFVNPYHHAASLVFD